MLHSAHKGCTIRGKLILIFFPHKSIKNKAQLKQNNNTQKCSTDSTFSKLQIKLEAVSAKKWSHDHNWDCDSMWFHFDSLLPALVTKLYSSMRRDTDKSLSNKNITSKLRLKKKRIWKANEDTPLLKKIPWLPKQEHHVRKWLCWRPRRVMLMVHMSNHDNHRGHYHLGLDIYLKMSSNKRNLHFAQSQ